MSKKAYAFYGVRKHGRPEVLVVWKRGPAQVGELPSSRLELPALAAHEARHSPGGFEWGYHGSGPAELARAILLTVFPEDYQIVRHPACYQHFKQDVVAELPHEFRLSVAEIRAWRAQWDQTESAARIREARDAAV